MTDLSTLIRLLEEAEEDTQHIAIYDAVKFARKQGWISENQEARAWVWRNVEAYLEIGLMLMPDGLGWEVHGEPLATKYAGNAAIEHPKEGWQFPFECDAARSPALALCIAALRAREEMTEKSRAQSDAEHGQHD